jgi:hypothetical protein
LGFQSTKNKGVKDVILKRQITPEIEEDEEGVNEEIYVHPKER